MKKLATLMAVAGLALGVLLFHGAAFAGSNVAIVQCVSPPGPGAVPGILVARTSTSRTEGICTNGTSCAGCLADLFAFENCKLKAEISGTPLLLLQDAVAGTSDAVVQYFLSDCN